VKTRQHPQTANAPKAKGTRKVIPLARAPQVRAPSDEISEWMAAAKREGRSFSNWLRRIANEAVVALKGRAES